MGLVLNITPYTNGNCDSLDIYRADSRLGERKLIKNISKDLRTFNDRSVEANRPYWYWVLSKSAQDGDRLSQPLSAGTFLDPGPGSNQLLRGDWDFGYFGFVPLAQMFDYTAVQQALGIAKAPDTQTLTGFHKCIVNGRILFIADKYYTNQINKAGLGNALLPQGADVSTATTLTVNSYTYRIRCPFSSTRYTTENTNTGTTPDSTLSVSEVAMLSALILGSATNGAFEKFKLADTANPALTGFFFSNTYAADNVANVFSLIDTASIGPAADMTANRPFWPVFELVVHN